MSEFKIRFIRSITESNRLHSKFQKLLKNVLRNKKWSIKLQDLLIYRQNKEKSLMQYANEKKNST